MGKGPKQQYVEILTITFQNDDPINDQIENTGKISVALQPKSPLHSRLYTISEVH